MLQVIQIGPLSIQTYPLALLLAGWAGLALAARSARRLGLEGDDLYNAGLYGFLGGLVAGRLGHVIAFWPAYRTQPVEIIGLNTSAFLGWTAIVGGLAVAGWYLRRRRLALATVLDAAGPGLLLGVAIAAVGALLAGRNPGAPTEAPWAIVMWGVRRHPSQVYEALAALGALGIALAALARRPRPGTVALISLAGYGLGRWLVEPFRAESALLAGGFRLAQVIGLAAALLALWWLGRRAGDPTQDRGL